MYQGASIGLDSREVYVVCGDWVSVGKFFKDRRAGQYLWDGESAVGGGVALLHSRYSQAVLL